MINYVISIIFGHFWLQLLASSGVLETLRPGNPSRPLPDLWERLILCWGHLRSNDIKYFSMVNFVVSIIFCKFWLQLLASSGVLDTCRPLTTSGQPLREVDMVLRSSQVCLVHFYKKMKFSKIHTKMGPPLTPAPPTLRITHNEYL